MKNWQEAVNFAPLSAIFFIGFLLLTREISNLALQAMEKVPDVSQILRDAEYSPAKTREYQRLLQTGSLDNAIREFSLA